MGHRHGNLTPAGSAPRIDPTWKSRTDRLLPDTPQRRRQESHLTTAPPTPEITFGGSGLRSDYRCPPFVWTKTAGHILKKANRQRTPHVGH